MDGIEGGGVLVIRGAVDGGGRGAGAEDDGDLVGDDGFGPAGESAFGRKSEKSDSLDTAGLENVGQLGVCLEKRIVCPEVVDLVARVWLRGFRIREGESERCDFVRRELW